MLTHDSANIDQKIRKPKELQAKLKETAQSDKNGQYEPPRPRKRKQSNRKQAGNYNTQGKNSEQYMRGKNQKGAANRAQNQTTKGGKSPTQGKHTEKYDCQFI